MCCNNDWFANVRLTKETNLPSLASSTQHASLTDLTFKPTSSHLTLSTGEHAVYACRCNQIYMHRCKNYILPAFSGTCTTLVDVHPGKLTFFGYHASDHVTCCLVCGPCLGKVYSRHEGASDAMHVACIQVTSCVSIFLELLVFYASHAANCASASSYACHASIIEGGGGGDTQRQLVFSHWFDIGLVSLGACQDAHLFGLRACPYLA